MRIFSLLAVLCSFWTMPMVLASPILNVNGKNLLDGKDVHLTSSQKIGLVVVFLSAKCPCSNSHIAEISTLASQFLDFSFLAVHSNSNEDEQMSKAYFESKKLPFPVIQDSASRLADLFKALKTPHAFVLNSKGDIVYQGGVSSSADFSKADKKYLRDALEDMRANRAVKVSNGRTLGCVIQRS